MSFRIHDEINKQVDIPQEQSESQKHHSEVKKRVEVKAERNALLTKKLTYNPETKKWDLVPTLKK